jgi:SagB-type dehydrogenase family enzyme
MKQDDMRGFVIRKGTVYSSVLHFLWKNVSLTRRQICQIGAVFVATLWSLMPFHSRHVLAKRSETLKKEERPMKLTPPVLEGHMCLEKAIKQRRTVRSFRDRPLDQQQFSQILWSAQGITQDGGFKRAAPSGGALYPADVYAVLGERGVRGLAAGLYHYDPADHSVRKMAGGDRRKEVAVASLSQMWMARAAVLFLITLEFDRITIKYGDRGIRYALIEVGHIGQNIFLQCQALGLRAGIVGAFDDKEVAVSAGFSENHEPLLIMPVGWED